MSVVDNTPRGKATGVSPWYGVYKSNFLLWPPQLFAALQKWPKPAAKIVLVNSQNTQHMPDPFACQSPCPSLSTIKIVAPTISTNGALAKKLEPGW